MQPAISKFLVTALIVTGVITVAVFAMPDLITLGLFLLILPGVLLAFTPTVFLYLMAFSLPWFLLSQRGIAVSALGGLATVAWVGFGLPSILNQRTSQRLFEAQAKEVAPSTRIAAARIVALQSLSGSAKDGCSDLCQTLLYNGSVERVILLPGKNVEGRLGQSISFRVNRMSSCPDTDPALQSERWGNTWLKGSGPSNIAQTVRLRIADGECLVKEEWTASPGLMLQRIKEDFGDKAGFLSLSPGEVRADGLQLMAGAQVVARQSHLVARRFIIPLHLTPREGSQMKIYGWEWGRTNRHQEPMDARPFLEQFTELDVAPPTGLNGKRIREHLDAALDDPSVPRTDGAFGLVKDYFEGLPRDHLEAADVRRMARLIKDSRVTSLEFPDYKLQPDQLLQLKDPMLDRLLLLAAANEWPVYHKLASRLRRMPEGAFRRPDPRVEFLLSSTNALVNSPVLVSRLADRGPSESERLFSFVREGYAPASKNRTRRRSEIAEAALRGLCRLGPAAQPILAGLRRAAEDGTVPPGMQDSDLWRATLVSLGANAEEFDLPKNRHWQIDRYRQSLRKLADNGCESR